VKGDATLRKQVSVALIARGFRRDGRMHLRRATSDISFWVDTGPLGNRTDIAPYLGIRSDAVEDAFGRWLGVPPDDFVGTFGGNVGYVLGGEYCSFQPPSTAEEVLEVIDQGLARYEPFLSLERLPQADAVAHIPDPGRSYRMVVIHALLRNLPAARSALVKAEQEYCCRDDEVCAQFRGFAQRARLECQGL